METEAELAIGQLEAAELDDVTPVPEGSMAEEVKAQNDELMHQILDDKRGQPNKYASTWEMDEENVEHWTKEEIQGRKALFKKKE